MQIASTILLVIHVLVAISLIGVVLVQRSEGGGLGMGGQSNAFMSVRGQTNLLTRSTAILAAVFFTTSISLAFLGGTHRASTGSFMQTPPAQSAPAAPTQPGAGAAPAPAAPPAGPTTPQAPTR